MVIGLPRSGTTWAANWLTTERSFCVHDPLYHMHYADWDSVLWCERRLEFTGVSCTGIWRWQNWVNSHPAPKLILHRALEAQRRSAEGHGMYIHHFKAAAESLWNIRGMHIDGEELWSGLGAAKRAWQHLLPRIPFDSVRTKALQNMRIEPVELDRGVDRKLQQRLKDELL